MTVHEINRFQEFLSKKEGEIMARFAFPEIEKVKLIFQILQADLDLMAEIEIEKEFAYFNPRKE